MKDLTATTRENIVKMYLEDHMFQKEIAKYYKVSCAIVSRLCREAETDLAKNRKLKQKEEEKSQKSEAVVTRMLENNVLIENAAVVAKQVQEH